MKILIDHNVRHEVRKILAEAGFIAESAQFHDLEDFSNGELTRRAFALGFRCILTQDRSFEKDAAYVLKKMPEMAIVLIDTLKLKQTPRSNYLHRFRAALKKEKLIPIAGKVTVWPRK